MSLQKEQERTKKGEQNGFDLSCMAICFVGAGDVPPRSASAPEAVVAQGPASTASLGVKAQQKRGSPGDDDSWLITLARAGLNQLLSPVALPGLMSQGGEEGGEIMRFPIQNCGGFIAVVITSAVSKARTRNHADFQVPDLLNNKMKSQHKSPPLTQVAAVGSQGACHTDI